MAKSAIMTTAHQDVMKEDGVSQSDPFDLGAGHLNPNPAVDPGLVYDAGLLDYAGFICGVTDSFWVEWVCPYVEEEGFPFDASDLNLPSIGIAALAGEQTIVRKVTNVGSAGTYAVTVDAPPGIAVSVVPNSLTLTAGETAPYEVTFTTVSATPNEWTFGSLTWTDGSHSVRSSIAIRPLAISAPYEIFGEGISGSQDFEVTFGYTGDYTAAPHGLEDVLITPETVPQDPDQDFDKDDGKSTVHEFDLTDAVFARFALPSWSTEAGADLDMFVYDPSGNLVGSSTRGGTDEVVDVMFPVDGFYKVYIHGWLVVTDPQPYDLYSWVIPETSGGSLSVDSAPLSAVVGTPGTIEVSWNGLTAGHWYLGAVSHNEGVDIFGLTLVNVEP